MTNRQVREELLELFEGITDKIGDGIYLKAMNLLKVMDVEQNKVDAESGEEADIEDLDFEDLGSERLSIDYEELQRVRNYQTLVRQAQDAVYDQNTDIFTMIENLKTRDRALVMPVLSTNEVIHIKNQCDRYRARAYRGYGHWYNKYMDREGYIYSSQSKRFLKRSGPSGRALENTCRLQQFPSVYAMGSHGRVVLRDYNAVVENLFNSF